MHDFLGNVFWKEIIRIGIANTNIETTFKFEGAQERGWSLQLEDREKKEEEKPIK